MAANIDDFHLTTEELATRWRMEPASLVNARYRGEGPPWIKTPTGRVLYRFREILELETAGERGFRFDAFEALVASLPFLGQDQKRELMKAVNGRFRPSREAA